MSRITQIKDRATEELLYPVTLAEAVIDENGLSLEGRLSQMDNKKVDKVSGSSLMTTAEHAKLEALSTDAQANAIEASWVELRALKNNGELQPGTLYIINDYIATSSQQLTSCGSDTWKIYVFGSGPRSFMSEAKLVSQNGNETYEIWYDFDNNTSKYSWAVADVELNYILLSDNTSFSRDSGDDTATLYAWSWNEQIRYTTEEEPQDGSAVLDQYGNSVPGLLVSRWNKMEPTGRGVIWKMRDVYGNEAFYDFRNIMFYLQNPQTSGYDYYYTFDLYGNGVHSHNPGAKCCRIGEIWGDGKRSLNRCIFSVNSDESKMENIEVGTLGHDIILLGADNLYDLRFDPGCRNINLLPQSGHSILSCSEFGRGCYDINLNGGFYYLGFGDYCHGVTCGSQAAGSCESIRVGHESSGIILYDCHGLRIGDYGSGINISGGRNIRLGDTCQTITLGNGCSNIELGDQCDNISLGQNSSGTRFGSRCSHIGAGKELSFCDFGPQCAYIYFSRQDTGDGNGEKFKRLVFHPGVMYLVVWEGTVSPSQAAQMYVFDSGCCGNSMSYLKCEVKRGNLYQTWVGKGKDGILEMKVLGDLEDETRKVSTLSSESTDVQYPSAKAVWDEFEKRFQSTAGFTYGTQESHTKSEENAQPGDLCFSGDTKIGVVVIKTADVCKIMSLGDLGSGAMTWVAAKETVLSYSVQNLSGWYLPDQADFEAISWSTSGSAIEGALGSGSLGSKQYWTSSENGDNAKTFTSGSIGESGKNGSLYVRAFLVVSNLSGKYYTKTESDSLLYTKVDKVSGHSLLPDTSKTEYDNHIGSTSNPHGVTKSQVGLGNCDNTSDANKPVSTATQTELNKKIEWTVVQSGAGTGYQGDSVLRYTEQGLSDAQKEQVRKNLGLDTEWINSKSVYGVTWNYGLGSPVLSRVGNLDLHKTLPVQSGLRRCILGDQGQVVYYLNPDNSNLKEDNSEADLSGTTGQVMVEIPEYYRKFTHNPDLKTYTCEISKSWFYGCHKVEKAYIGAYEAALDRTDMKLCSIVNSDARYRGGNNTSSWDGTYRSLLGLPCTSVNLTNFRTYAKNRGTGWGIQDMEIYQDLIWLYFIEYANLNCQAGYMASKDSNGYSQGGLGSGVTGISDWSGYNSYNPVIPCGVTGELGNKTGVVTYNVLKSDGTSTHYAAPVPSYRGVENPFGHIWKWTDGFLGLGDGVRQTYYTSHSKKDYASSLNASYTKVGLSPEATAGWAKEFLFNEFGDILCGTLGSSSSTWTCDYHYNAHTSGTVYGLFLGGDSNIGSIAGVSYCNSYCGPSVSSSYFGSRLCWSNGNTIITK